METIFILPPEDPGENVKLGEDILYVLPVSRIIRYSDLACIAIFILPNFIQFAEEKVVVGDQGLDQAFSIQFPLQKFELSAQHIC